MSIYYHIKNLSFFKIVTGDGFGSTSTADDFRYKNTTLANEAGWLSPGYNFNPIAYFIQTVSAKKWCFH